MDAASEPSYVHGASPVPLLGETIGQNLDRTAARVPDNDALVSVHQGVRQTYAQFHTAVEEIFDVQLLGGFEFPEVMGFHKDTLHHTFIVPDPTASLQDNWAGRRGCRDESPARLTSKLALRGGRAPVPTI